jgi:UDP-N-acetylmuramoyl-tripeptide--D-alanyl-D-alanine ligase
MKKITKKLVASRLAKKVQKLLKNNDITVIIVTGSVGKTSTKVAIGKLLSSKHQVQFSEDSYNTDIGLPLSFFGLKAPSPLWDPLAWKRIFQKIDATSKYYPYDVVVLEMADDELEDMLKLLKFIKPKYGVITGIAPVHMERMISMNKVVRDNWEIAKTSDVVFYNTENEDLYKLASKSKKSIGFGMNKGKLKFSNIKRSTKGYLEGNMNLAGSKIDVKTKMIGKHNLNSLLAAAGVAQAMGMNEKDIAKGVSSIAGVNGRMKLLKGKNGSQIIDDSYNSSPDAVISALSVLKEFNSKNKIAVLGNMNELGDESKDAHYKIGKASATVADMLIVIGKDAEIYTVSGAKDAGMNPDNIKIFKTPYEIGHFLKRIIEKGDLVLVKGSQNGVFSEEVVRILLDPSLDAKDYVVRQSKGWKRKKRKAFGL